MSKTVKGSMKERNSMKEKDEYILYLKDVCTVPVAPEHKATVDRVSEILKESGLMDGLEEGTFLALDGSSEARYITLFPQLQQVREMVRQADYALDSLNRRIDAHAISKKLQ